MGGAFRIRVPGIAGVLLLAACAIGPARHPAPPAGSLALTHVNIVDVRSGRVLADSAVIVAGERIAYTGPMPVPRRWRGVDAVDSRGKYVIPGLWDAHVHLFRHDPPSSREDTWFPLFVANGVTSVREMFTNFDDLPSLRALRAQVAAGRIGPRIRLAGQLVDGPSPIWPGSIVAGSPDEGRAVVRRIKAGGGDFVKVYSLLSRETYYAIADEAGRQHIPFAGHVPDSVRVLEASRAGQRTLEHAWNIDRDCSRSDRSLEAWSVIRRRSGAEYNQHIIGEYDAAKCKDLFAALARDGTWMTVDLVLRAPNLEEPRWTQSPNLQYVPRSTIDRWHAQRAPGSRPPAVMQRVAAREAIKTGIIAGLHAAGARLLAGTDVGNPYLVPGFSLHEDLELMVTEAGMSPLAALRTATLNPARFAGMEASLGTVEAGKLADLVVLEANPLDDIRNSTKIAAVVANGRYHDRAALDALLGEARRAASVEKAAE
jgi:hypothetical protein